MPDGEPNLLDRALRPLQEFLRLEAAAGLVLMAAAALAMIVANSPLERYYAALLDVTAEIRIGDYGLAKPLLLWINDGLMALFFFLVGMELKRELAEGHLSSLRQAILPAFAAAGGMAVPAAIYCAFNWGDPAALKGWAIPTATDIAFALGVLSLLGARVRARLKVFVLSVAIFDDIGAIIVIAAFYTDQLSVAALGFAGMMVAVLAALNVAGVARPAAYLLAGVALWVAILKSGAHATLAGVVLGFFIPMRAGPAPEGGCEPGGPLHRLTHALHPWIAFGVLPVFAFANSGVTLPEFTAGNVLHPVPMGIVAGLLVGKFTGIVAASWVAVKLGAAALAPGMRWSHLAGAAVLCGIGFTMSLFIASLAFGDGASGPPALGRLGILAGSLASGLAGYLFLRRVLDDARAPETRC
ncbi:MAG: Na+/H+ antiporter NhaA [Burkholderiales bacterium]|nr:Na+/H+ antiporter NhaA [Burkholderiales bacterium]